MPFVVAGTYEGHIVGYSLSPELLSSAPTSASDDSPALAPPPPTFALHAHDGCVKAVAAGSALLATSGTDCAVGVYNLRRLRTQGALLQQDGGTSQHCLAFFHDSHLLSGGEDGELCIWRASDWECLLRMKGHKATINAVAIHPSGKLALSVAADSKLMLWNLTTGKCNYTSALPEQARMLSWSLDGESYAYEGRTSISIYGLRSGALVHSLPHETSAPIAMAFLSAEHLVSGDERGALRVWDLGSGQCVHTVEHAHARRIKALAAVPVESDGASGAPAAAFASASTDGTISVWALVLGGGAAGEDGVSASGGGPKGKKVKRSAASGDDAGAPVQLTKLVSIFTRSRITSLCVNTPKGGGAGAGGDASGGASSGGSSSNAPPQVSAAPPQASAAPPKAKVKASKRERIDVMDDPISGDGTTAAAKSGNKQQQKKKLKKKARHGAGEDDDD